MVPSKLLGGIVACLQLAALVHGARAPRGRRRNVAEWYSAISLPLGGSETSLAANGGSIDADTPPPGCENPSRCTTCVNGWSCTPSSSDISPTDFDNSENLPTDANESGAAPTDGVGDDSQSPHTSGVSPDTTNFAPPATPTCQNWIVCSTCSPQGYKCLPTAPAYDYGGVSSTDPVSTPTDLASCLSSVPCNTCEQGFTCVITRGPDDGGSTAPSTTPNTDVSGTDLTACSSFVQCSTCLGGFSCVDDSNTTSSTDGSTPIIGTPTCSSGQRVVACSTASNGYYCINDATPSPSSVPPRPICKRYTDCPSCYWGYTCTQTPPPSPTMPPRSCSTWQSCLNCPGGYRCLDAKTPDDSYTDEDDPGCVNPLPCATCSGGFRCASPSEPTEGSEAPMTTVPPLDPYDPPVGIPYALGDPFCSDYIICPTCPNGYYCPSEIAPNPPNDPNANRPSSCPENCASRTSTVTNTVTTCDISRILSTLSLPTVTSTVSQGPTSPSSLSPGGNGNGNNGSGPNGSTPGYQCASCSWYRYGPSGNNLIYICRECSQTPTSPSTTHVKIPGTRPTAFRPLTLVNWHSYVTTVCIGAGCATAPSSRVTAPPMYGNANTNKQNGNTSGNPNDTSNLSSADGTDMENDGSSDDSNASDNNGVVNSDSGNENNSINSSGVGVDTADDNPSSAPHTYSFVPCIGGRPCATCEHGWFCPPTSTVNTNPGSPTATCRYPVPCSTCVDGYWCLPDGLQNYI